MRYHSTSLAAFHNASKCNSVKCLQHHRGLDCGDLHGVASEGTLIATVSIIKAASNTNTRVTTEPHKIRQQRDRCDPERPGREGQGSG